MLTAIGICFGDKYNGGKMQKERKQKDNALAEGSC